MCSNEEEVNIEVFQNADYDLKRDFGENFEVIVIDNCSDSTFKIVSKFIKRTLKLLEEYNKLYSGSNNSILIHSKGKFIATVDGDGQHSMRDIKKSIDLLTSSKSKVFFGWKKYRDDSLLRKITSRGFKIVTKIFLKNDLNDINCGFRIFESSLKEKIILNEKVNSAGPEFFCLCRKFNIPYIEGPVIHFRRHQDGLFNSLPKFIFGGFSFFKYVIRLKNIIYNDKLIIIEQVFLDLSIKLLKRT